MISIIPFFLVAKWSTPIFGISQKRIEIELQEIIIDSMSIHYDMSASVHQFEPSEIPVAVKPNSNAEINAALTRLGFSSWSSIEPSRLSELLYNFHPYKIQQKCLIKIIKGTIFSN